MFDLLNKIDGWVQDGPMGNDKQFLPLVAAGVGLGMQAYGAHRAGRTSNIPGALGSGDLAGHFSGVRDMLGSQGMGGTVSDMQGTVGQMGGAIGQARDSIGGMQEGMGRMGGLIGQMQQGYGQMQEHAQGLMDPRSAANQQQYRMMQGQGNNQLAMQALLNKRQAAASGQSSGITQAQNRAAQRGMGANLLDQFNQQMGQNRMAGIGLASQNQGLLQGIGGMEQARHGMAGDIFGARQGIAGMYGNMAGVQQGIAGVQGGIADREMGISENLAQADIAKRHSEQQRAIQKNQQAGGVWSGIGSGIMDTFFGGLGG